MSDPIETLAPAALPSETLCRRCDPASLPFESTAELAMPDEPLGQRRAAVAMEFGVGLRRPGYNVFALGPPGIGRHTVVRDFLDRRAAAEPTPPDWCYVHNFAEPSRPRALRLPAGRGRALATEVDHAVDELQTALPAVLESDEYRARHQALDKEMEKQRGAGLAALGAQAEVRGVALVNTPGGLMIAPARAGQVIEPDAFVMLPEAEQAKFKAAMEAMGEELSQFMAQVQTWAREHRAKVRELRRQMTQAVVDHHLAEVRSHHADLPEVMTQLDAVARALAENVHEFASAGDSQSEPAMAEALRRLMSDGPALHRYRVNLIVDQGDGAAGRQSGGRGAPVIYEDRPSLANLVGRVDHVQRFGALSTDFTLIKAGALHRANGGYLILDARKVLLQPFAWDELKRALTSGCVRIESLVEMAGMQATESLQPEAIPLDVKVVLVGERLLYYMLAEADPDFLDVFKIEADFEEEIDRTDATHLAYARWLGAIVKREGLLPLDRGAVARMIEHASRLAGDAERLSTHAHGLADLARESDHFATIAGRPAVSAGDVDAAIAAAEHRRDRIRGRVIEDIRRGTIFIDTQGARVGCVNGLSVSQLGRWSFGRPARITARVRPGHGEVIDIEREVELGGPLHSKGVLILSSYLAARYAGEAPLALSASLVFEQSYGGVEGDSASAAELFALLSALAGAPIAQGIAVTGSVNQHGEVQPIGGVNEKIEGFFDVCRAVGARGAEGVLIPAANVKHLMLRRDVVEAAAAGRFRVFPYATIDEGLALLTALPAGERDAAGHFPDGSVNARVEARLRSFAETARAFARPDDKKP